MEKQESRMCLHDPHKLGVACGKASGPNQSSRHPNWSQITLICRLRPGCSPIWATNRIKISLSVLTEAQLRRYSRFTIYKCQGRSQIVEDTCLLEKLIPNHAHCRSRPKLSDTARIWTFKAWRAGCYGRYQRKRVSLSPQCCPHLLLLPIRVRWLWRNRWQDASSLRRRHARLPSGRLSCRTVILQPALLTPYRWAISIRPSVSAVSIPVVGRAGSGVASPRGNWNDDCGADL